MAWIPDAVNESVPPDADHVVRPRMRLKISLQVFTGLAAGCVIALAAVEMRTSLFSALLLHPWAVRMQSTVAAGPSNAVLFPHPGGPYDARLGYSGMPAMLARLQAHGWQVVAQARFSPALQRWMHVSGHAVYPEKNVAGLLLSGRDGSPLYQVRFPDLTFGEFSRVPDVLTRSLLQIEDRHLLEADTPMRNPAVDWSRFLLAVGGRMLHRGQGGASTLATQIEKFRHSPEGRTENSAEKLRQMITASLRVYARGTETLAARRSLVTTYLDSVPLASRPGYGEVVGLGDGLRAWYGLDFEQTRRLLAAAKPPYSQAQAAAYKQALSLMLAERRPTYYLVSHHDRLDKLTDHYLDLLASRGAITAQLRDVALSQHLQFRESVPEVPAPAFVERKAVDALRNELQQGLDVDGLGSLDRLNLSAQSTIDGEAQHQVTETLQRLADPAFAASLGMVGRELLPASGLDHVLYGVLVYERGPHGNELRVHADSLDEPFDINSGAKLILGSTAKLRTLVTYLDIVAGLHHQYANLAPAQREAQARDAGDPLSLWAADYLRRVPDADLRAMLEAAMQRHYSGNPHRSFFTGGGEHVFHNFKKFEDVQNPTVEDAFERSVNLAFIRLMQDLVRYYIATDKEGARTLLSDVDNPARRDYLHRFADQEGSAFIERYYDDYRGLDPAQIEKQLTEHVRQRPLAVATALMVLNPAASLQSLNGLLEQRFDGENLESSAVQRFYDGFRAGRFTFADLGYLAGVNPLELWTAAYLKDHPSAPRTELLQVSGQQRQQAYDWLFRTHHAARQNERIRVLLEQKAFRRIADDWHRQGYPFRSLVPSLASAIGSSGDRPDALADLVGIISAGGMRLPGVDLTRLRFAEGTPYATDLVRLPAPPERVMDAQEAEIVRRALYGAVQRGTAQRLLGGYLKADGSALPVGGKTGTGDNRYDSYASGHRLLQSRAVDRSATFAFILGDRHFGVVTIYVPGTEAARFHFTSALAVQLLRALAPALSPLIEGTDAGAATAAPAGGGIQDIDAGE